MEKRFLSDMYLALAWSGVRIAAEETGCRRSALRETGRVSGWRHKAFTQAASPSWVFGRAAIQPVPVPRQNARRTRTLCLCQR